MKYPDGSIFPAPQETEEEKTIRKFIVIRESLIPGAGKGAFAAKNIPANASLGPYRGYVMSKKILDQL